MNILDKGKLTVALATVVASGMILTTGNIVADSEKKLESKLETAPVSISKGEPKSVVSAASHKNRSLTPPPGPFMKRDYSGVNMVQKTPLAPTEPRQPNTRVVEPNQPVISKKSGIAPSFPFSGKPPVMSFDPTKNATTEQQAQTKKPILEPQQLPIWVQQNNDVVNASNGQTIAPKSKKMPPINPVMPNWNNQSAMKMPNMGWGYSQQQYIYVPVPMVPPSYTIPQVPNYWVPTPANKKGNN